MSSRVTFDVTVMVRLLVWLLKVNCTGRSVDPKNPVEPEAETSTLTNSPERFVGITFTSATSASKFSFIVFTPGTVPAEYDWLKFTALTGTKAKTAKKNANTSTAIRMTAGNALRRLTRLEDGASEGTAVTATGEPHTRQNLASSSNFAPHFRQ